LATPRRPGLLPGESVTLTNGGVTVYGIVEELTSSEAANNTTNWTLAVNVTSFAGIAVGAGAPGGTGTVTTPQTNTLNLNPGGLTSVAAGRNTVLFGYTQNGSWYYNGTPAASGIGTLSSVTAPPIKLITLNGANVSVTPGATLDASGGGELFAGAFIPGTGGSLNIFIGQNKNLPAGVNVYAVIPGYTGITPYDPYISTSSPSVGQLRLFNLPTKYATAGSITVGANAQLTSDNSLMVFTSGSSTLAFGVGGAKVTAQAAEFKSVEISLGADCRAARSPPRRTATATASTSRPAV
jgi:hypothetical protein